LITKERYWQKPTYDDLEKSLLAMREHCVVNNVVNLAMPRIGCGLDGLNWNKVKNLLENVFQHANVKIKVCFLYHCNYEYKNINFSRVIILLLLHRIINGYIIYGNNTIL